MLRTIFLYALLTAVATGLGALPFARKKKFSKSQTAKANAIAAALMITASFGMIYE
jgi:zinc transporter, ZIP family